MKNIVAFLGRHRSAIIIALTLLVGAYLRLYRISEYMTFLGDEGRDVLVVKRMIVDGKFTLLGPTASVGGFFLGPVYYYFMLPFLWLFRLDPAGPAVMVALFGIATIYLVYAFTRRAVNPFAAHAAAALYAVSPVVIAYSRSSWNPNVVPFFALGLVHFLNEIQLSQKKRDYFLAGVMLGIGIQLHYLFLFLFAVSGIYLISLAAFARVRHSLKQLLSGTAGVIAGVSPFLAFELRHGFANTQSVIRFLQTGKDTGFSFATFWSNVTDVWYRLFARLVFRMPEANALGKLSETVSALWQAGAVFLAVSSTAVLAVFVYRTLIARTKARKGTQTPMQYMLLTLWLAVPVILFGFYRRAIYDYYLGIMFPLPFILTGLFFSFLARWKRLIPVAALSVAGLLYLNWEGRPFKYPPNNQLAQVRRIAEVAFEKTGSEPFNFALITDGNSDHAYRYFFEIWGKPPVTIENKDADPERATVTGQLIIICEKLEPDCQPLGNSLWEVAGFGRAEITGSWQVPFVTVYRLVHYGE